MMSRGAVLVPVLERFGSEEWKFRGPKNEQKSDIFLENVRFWVKILNVSGAKNGN